MATHYNTASVIHVGDLPGGKPASCNPPSVCVKLIVSYGQVIFHHCFILLYAIR